jgi:hypothetical protein
MVLATGYELIDDVRRAPDYVLSRIEPINEVYSVSVQNGAFILTNDYLVHSARIHATLIGDARRMLHRHNSFQISAGHSRYFPGDQGRTRYGHE